MSRPSEMAERHSRICARLAEIALTLAEAMGERALAAETPAEAAQLTQAVHTISRSARQSMALEARLERERRLALREDRARAEREAAERIAKRRAETEAAVKRLIWTEAEGKEAEEMEGLLDELLDEATVAHDFTTIPVETHIRRLCDDLGLTYPPAEDREPEGLEAVSAQAPRPQSAADDEDDWRSSA